MIWQYPLLSFGAAYYFMDNPHIAGPTLPNHEKSNEKSEVSGKQTQGIGQRMRERIASALKNFTRRYVASYRCYSFYLRFTQYDYSRVKQ